MGKYTRPAKPYKGYPLYAHPSGNWAKKIRGKLHYFGRWGRVHNGRVERLPDDGRQAALALFRAQEDDLRAGRTPRKGKDGELVLADLCNAFLTAKLRRMESGELSPRSFQEYKQTCDRLIAAFGRARLVDDLAASDFERLRADAAKRVGPVRLGNEITRVKSVFKYAAENKLIDRPITFGSEFCKPGKATLRKHRAASDKKLFTAVELRTMLESASPQLKAAILLGLNAGLGNSDVAGLRREHLRGSGWLNYPRVKTGVGRRVPLWSETVDALQALGTDGDQVFRTGRGTPVVRVSETSRTDYVGREFAKLLRSLGINGRKGLGLYSLRHTFATVALQTGDRDAVKALMGHVENDMLAAYDETGPGDDRLRRVVEHVHTWLFPVKDKKR